MLKDRIFLYMKNFSFTVFSFTSSNSIAILSDIPFFSVLEFPHKEKKK